MLFRSNARLHTGRLRVLRPACPHLLAEAGLYRYPTPQERKGEGELPLDAHNHALGALRYLISRLDARFLARLRRPVERGAPSAEREERSSSRSAHGAPRSTLDAVPWTPLI